MIAAILAKRSERFPGKHMKFIGEETMVGIIARTLSSSAIFERVIVFTKDSSVKTDFAKVISDDTEGTALNSIISLIEKYGEVFVAAGDMPMLSSEFISKIVSAYHGTPVFPIREDGEIEPLFGIYNVSMLEIFNSVAQSGEKRIKEAIKACVHETITAGKYESSLLNVNQESDLQMLLRK